MKSNVTDMNGQPVNPNGNEEFDTYEVRFYDLDYDDEEYIHTVHIRAAPIMTATYLGFATNPSSVELLIPFDRLITLRKVESSDGQTQQ